MLFFISFLVIPSIIPRFSYRIRTACSWNSKAVKEIKRMMQTTWYADVNMRKKYWISHFAAKCLVVPERVLLKIQYPYRILGLSINPSHFTATQKKNHFSATMRQRQKSSEVKAVTEQLCNITLSIHKSTNIIQNFHKYFVYQWIFSLDPLIFEYLMNYFKMAFAARVMSFIIK